MVRLKGRRQRKTKIVCSKAASSSRVVFLLQCGNALDFNDSYLFDGADDCCAVAFKVWARQAARRHQLHDPRPPHQHSSGQYGSHCFGGLLDRQAAVAAHSGSMGPRRAGPAEPTGARGVWLRQCRLFFRACGRRRRHRLSARPEPEQETVLCRRQGALRAEHLKSLQTAEVCEDSRIFQIKKQNLRLCGRFLRRLVRARTSRLEKSSACRPARFPELV